MPVDGKLSVQDIAHLKKQSPEHRKKLVVLTAYDFLSAKLIDPHVDIILVGDSLGMVVQGNKTTLGVTVDQMVYHTQAVARGVHKAHLVADMPFMSYQASIEDALRNAGRLLSEGGAESVKLEGGVSVAPTVARLVEAGIPVMGHIGLTPQSVHQMGGFKIQGKTSAARESLLSDALALEDSGAYAIVLEGMPVELSSMITERLTIPTIGIGAGNVCDGQVLVLPDLLGMNKDFRPKFVKAYANLSSIISDAAKNYAEEVKSGAFPSRENTFYADS